MAEAAATSFPAGPARRAVIINAGARHVRWVRRDPASGFAAQENTATRDYLEDLYRDWEQHARPPGRSPAARHAAITGYISVDQALTRLLTGQPAVTDGELTVTASGERASTSIGRGTGTWD